MAYDFPASPSVGTLYAPAGGPTWQWNGTGWTNVSPAGLVPEAPVDDQNYVRQNGLWVPAPGTAEARNRIVNGGMQISQENAPNTYLSNSGYAADQWLIGSSIATALAVRGTVRSATGSYSISLTSGSTAKPALASGDYLLLRQFIEGNRLADLAWGTANAKPALLRLSASSLNQPFTFVVSIRTPVSGYSFLKNCTITAAAGNTFVIPIPAQSGGTWPTDNTAGLILDLTVAVGTSLQGVEGWQTGSLIGTVANTNLMANANTWVAFSNVGLHLDPLATGIAPKWQLPDDAQELAACMRYWEKTNGGYFFFSGNVTSGSNYYASKPYSVIKRIAPAVSGVDAGSSTSFAAVAGTFVTDYGANVREVRTANATQAGLFFTTVTANARM